ncbi:MAG: flagellar motor protein MotD [Methylococcaceae bacterium]|nr:flagellar motor protein MotD [Methylococcaceae bacterium]
MARKRRKRNYFDDSHNHERWLVSYADFVTLLFAFFVVMYSISSVNDAKYVSLSEALDDAFSKNNKVKKVIDPIQIGSEPTTIKPIILENPSAEEIIKNRQLSEEILKERRLLQMVSEQFEDVLQPYVENDLVEVKRHDFWIELEMNSQLLFLSGEAELSSKAIPVLKKVSEVVRIIPNVINVEGHTDNVPIDTVEFPSNWDLSSARATSVVREFVKNGISEKRLSAVGYGEFHPVADNNTEEGRFKNRRVVLVLMSQAFARYGMNDKERAKVLNLTDSVEPAKEEQVIKRNQ